jgi:protein-tyrosine phosphatase
MLGRVLKAIRTRLAVRRAMASARDDNARALAKPIRRVLVMCYGNIYRSPFVAESLRQALPGALEVRSAGFHAKIGRPSPEAHVRMSQSVGVDLSSHRSSLVSADDLAWADLIVIMDRHNWARLRDLQAPADKLLWLGGLMPGDVEIPDPYGLSPEAARAVVDRLAACTTSLAGSLRKA